MIVWMYEEKQYVVIQEIERKYKIMHITCKKIIDELCYLYGATYEGNRYAICQCLDITKNVPILTSFHQRTIFFPIQNNEKRRWWVNYNYVEKIYRKDECNTTLYLKYTHEINIQASYRSVYRQLQRCKMYLKILETSNIQNYLDHLYMTHGCPYEE